MATASGPGDVLQASEGKTRFVRLTRLLRCGGTKVMRELFDYKIPPTDLVAKLLDPSVAATLRHMKSNRILTDPQWQKLYPSSSAGPVQSTAFDITLLFTLLKENVISGFSPPSTGWNMLPNIHDRSLPADMARIKYYRNFIAHGDETMELSVQDFSDYWKEIKEALVRIVGHYAASGSSTVRDWETAIDRLLTDPLTEDDQSWCLTELRAFKEKILSVILDNREAEMRPYLHLGDVHVEKEEDDDAISYYQKSLVIAQESGDKDAEMNMYLELGGVYRTKNEYDDAYSCIEKGDKLAKERKDDKAILSFGYFYGMIYEEVGIDKPDDKYEYILKRTLLVPGGCHKRIKQNPAWYNSYAEYKIHRQEHNYEQAMSCLKEAEAAAAAKQGDNSIQWRTKLWLCKQGIAELHVLLGQYDEAVQYAQEAIDVAITKAQQAKSHFGLGEIYYKLGQLENAERSLKESLKCYELIFDDLKQNDRFKIAFVYKYENAYKMLLKVLIETNKKEEALALSDHYRAKALKDLLVSSFGVNEEPIARDVLQHAELQSLVSSRKYSLLLYSTCFEKLCTFLVEAGNELEFSVQHFEYCDTCLDKLVLKAFADMKVQVVNCADGSLDVLDDSEENRNPKEDELTRSLTRAIEKSLSEQCRSICGCRGEPSENNDENSLTSGLEILYHKLIEKMKCLVKQDEIVIIPEGPLCKVPFAALRDPDTGQYLSETKRIRMAPSIATLKLLQEYPEEHHSSKDALIIGSPLVGRVMLNEVETEISPLLGALDEAIDIARILGVQPLLAADATKPAVIKRLHEGASVVHIAAHGNLEKASIVLAPPEMREEKIPDEEDYMLTMADVQQTQVRAQLVVLSCCYSGRGQIKAEGVVGMCRAFLASGARAVMGSLWAVDDDATRDFMKMFYKYLKDGKSASTSLHLTMNDMKRTLEYSEPKYWAPFFLMGDDVTIQFED